MARSYRHQGKRIKIVHYGFRSGKYGDVEKWIRSNIKMLTARNHMVA